MNILLLTEVFPPRTGGSGRWLWELYRRLPPAMVHVVAGQTPGADRFDRQASMPIDRVHLHFSNWGVWNWRGAPLYVRALIRFNRIVSRVRPDVIHIGKCLPEGVLATVVKKRRGIPFYCYAHGEELTLAGTSKEIHRLTGRVLRDSDTVIANSKHTERLLTKDWGIAAEKIVVMTPGVDTTRFVPAPPSREVREKLGWAGRRVILTVGALQKRKGQDMMIRALPAIRAACPDVLFSMIGEGWERPYLDQLVAENGVEDLVQFRGVPDDDELIQCYQQCDVFALPNRQVGWDFEGFGIVLLEAQACGKPVVAGTSGGAPETMQPALTGDLVDCETPGPLGEAVVGLLTEPERRTAMGARGRSWVVEHFDWTVLSLKASTLFSTCASQ